MEKRWESMGKVNEVNEAMSGEWSDSEWRVGKVNGGRGLSG